MKKTMNVSELTGSALDYAVDRAAHGTKYSEQLSVIRTSGDAFRPSSSWRACGPLMEKWQISVRPPHNVHKSMVGPGGKRTGVWECYECWTATISTNAAEKPPVNPLFPISGCYRGAGDTPQLAICRAIASMGGDQIDIPFELLKSKGDAK